MKSKDFLKQLADLSQSLRAKIEARAVVLRVFVPDPYQANYEDLVWRGR